MAEKKNFSVRFQETVNHFYTMKYGGTVDTMGVVAMGLGVLGAAPAIAGELAGSLFALLPMTMAGVGAAWGA